MLDILFSHGAQKMVSLAAVLPIASFSFVGSLIEEIFSPIPSTLIAITIGLASVAQGKGLLLVIFYAFLESAGKTVASFFFYFLADKAEDLATGRFGKLLGLSHKDIERVGDDLEKRKMDDFLIFTSRIIPAFPTLPVTLACGLIKYDLKKYTIFSLIGFWFRSLLIILPVYYGALNVDKALKYLNYFESYGLIVVTIVIFCAISWLIRRDRKKNRSVV